MYLIAGLGNPGKQYEATRHNMGFDVIDKLVEEFNVPQAGVKFNAMYGKGRIGGEPVILMKPLSYMNLSGGPIRDMANYFKIDPETELIVIYDDIDTEPGQLRVRKKGSAGGHRKKPGKPIHKMSFLGLHTTTDLQNSTILFCLFLYFFHLCKILQRLQKCIHTFSAFFLLTLNLFIAASTLSARIISTASQALSCASSTS